MQFARARCMGGYALIMTLWALVLLTALAMDFSFHTRRGSASTRNFKEETQAYYRAIGAYEEALAYILNDKDYAVDMLDNGGDFWTDMDRETVTGEKKEDGADVKIHITDEESKININLVPEPMLRRLFLYAGVPEEDVDSLVDSVMDWKDADDLHRLSGAEDDYYESLDTPYEAKNSFFEVPEELLLVKGFKPEYYKALSGMITTFGFGMNVNTVGEKLMTMLGIDELTMESVMKSRTREQGGLRVIPPALTAAGIGLTQSHHFRIETSAKMAGSSQTMKITSIIRRTVKPAGVQLRTVYWKETIESSGA